MNTNSPDITQALASARKPLSALRIGFIGMGLMGIPMAQRLVQAGIDVHVWNRSANKLLDKRLTGATSAPNLAHLASHCDLILLCISNTEAVESVVFGTETNADEESQGLAKHLRPHHLLVDFSSIAPDKTREFSQRLLKGSSTPWVDAPVSGGVAGAENGTLAIMAGGPKDIIEALLPVFNLLAQRTTHMGDCGSGQTTKICNQMIVSCNVAVMAEVLAMAETAGVDANKIPQALQGGFADSIPLQITGQRMAARDYEDLKWRVDTLLKDLTMAKNLSAENGSRVPMSELAQTIFKSHSKAGFGADDPATLIDLYSQ